MGERFSWLSATVEVLWLPTLLGVGMVIVHYFLKQREGQQFAEYLTTMPGFDTTKQD